jgi:mRNA interferase MazF
MPYNRGDVVLVLFPDSNLVTAKESSYMGLLSDSVVMTDNLATISDSEIDRTIGHCGDMPAIDATLRHTPKGL